MMVYVWPRAVTLSPGTGSMANEAATTMTFTSPALDHASSEMVRIERIDEASAVVVNGHKLAGVEVLEVGSMARPAAA